MSDDNFLLILSITIIYVLFAAAMQFLSAFVDNNKAVHYFKFYFLSMALLWVVRDLYPQSPAFFIVLSIVSTIYFLFLGILKRDNKKVNFLWLNTVSAISILLNLYYYYVDNDIIYRTISTFIFFIPIILLSSYHAWNRHGFNNKADKILAVFIFSYLGIYFFRAFIITDPDDVIAYTWLIWQFSLPIIFCGIGIFLIMSYMLEGQLRLKNISTHDPLTGLLNRRGFDEAIGYQLPLLARNNQSLAIVTIDIDFFKKVNDKYGHATGDYALCFLADILQQSVRKNDLLVRMGGEEFVVVLSNVNKSQAFTIVEKIRQQIEVSPLNYEKNTFYLTCSFGISCGEALNINFHDHLALSDQAVYQAKQTGRNRICQA